MPLKSREVISVLKDLIEVCKDGEHGFKDAADDVKDESVQKILLKHSVERGLFSLELQSIVIKMGGQMEFSGSIFGILHRRWMDVKFGIAGSNTESILNECARGDNAAISAYEKAVSRELPPEILSIVKRQHDAISEVRESILQLIGSLGLHVKPKSA